MTHSSGRDNGAGSGRSGDAFARSRSEQEPQGGWGWFTKVKGEAEDGRPEPAGNAPAPEGRSGVPSRPPTAIRPVGTGADRRTQPPGGPSGGFAARESLFGRPPARDTPPPATGYDTGARYGAGPTAGYDSGARYEPGSRYEAESRYESPEAARYEPEAARYDAAEARYDAGERFGAGPADRFGAGSGPASDSGDRYDSGRAHRAPAPRYDDSAPRYGDPGHQDAAAHDDPLGRDAGFRDPRREDHTAGGREHTAGRPPAPRRALSGDRFAEPGYDPVADAGAPPRWADRPGGGAPGHAGRPADPAPSAGSPRTAPEPPAGGWFGGVAGTPDAAPEPSAATPPEPDHGDEPAPAAERASFPPPVRYGEPEPAEEEPVGTASFGPDEKASPDAVLIRRTMRVIEPVADKTTSYFYALLFLQHPDLRELFPAAMDTQRDRLFRALLTAAKHVDDADTLTQYLANLGRGHRKYGTRPEHYPAVGECLIGALTRYASEIWNDEVEAAWVRAYTAISQIMIDAASEDERTAPPWWQAEIVAHERRTADIAVVTVRPDQPYPFLAGQYASLEVPWWPRVWRHYSFAAAPRPDGLLSFHVKAVPAGWVSSAIVNRARAGDVIRIGPPAGTMTVNHESADGLLCLGGGTGIAPIKALVEDVAEHGRRRPVDVFYAARSGHDLYDLDTMLELEARYSWLSVRPVVTDTIGAPGGLVTGHLPDIVTRFGPWPAYDAYLSGPPGMIRSGVDALLGIGMPNYRIRHDSLEELVSARD